MKPLYNILYTIYLYKLYTLIINFKHLIIDKATKKYNLGSQ